MTTVLVLNAGYEPLHKVSVHHAIRMLVREVAVIEEASDEMFGDFPKPLVLRLVNYVKIKWRKLHPTWSKKGLMFRDKNKCGYCGKRGNSVDHIVPRSKGGKTEWLNTVIACIKCNGKKGSKTLKESGMKLMIEITTPSWYDVV
jgi:hypothetical protein